VLINAANDFCHEDGIGSFDRIINIYRNSSLIFPYGWKIIPTGDSIMKKILIIAGLIVFVWVVTSVIADDNTIPPEKDKIIFSFEKTDPVTFVHSTHMALDKMDCKKCHFGPLDPKEQTFTCRGCHTLKNVKMSMEDAFHKFCIACHKKQEYKDKNAPVDCAGCHKGATAGQNKG
jgi:hypothetical protein